MRRHEDRELFRRLVLFAGGGLAILVFLLIYGFKLLVGFSLTVDKFRSSGQPTPTAAASLVLPPSLDPPVEATNSAYISVTGNAGGAATVLLFVNSRETDDTVASKDGTFKFTQVKLTEGNNTILAKIRDTKNKLSEASNAVSVLFKKSKPQLEVTAPADNTTINGDTNTVPVTGKVEDGTTVKINDRFAVVGSDGSFSYDYPLPDGDTTLKITAIDQAGNETVIERKVTYRR